MISQSRKEWRIVQIGPKDLFDQVQGGMRFGFYLSKQLFLTHQNKINITDNNMDEYQRTSPEIGSQILFP